MEIYATVGDKVASRINKKDEKEFYTVEGERVVGNCDVGDGEKFRDMETAIRTLWPNATIRFEKDKR